LKRNFSILKIFFLTCLLLALMDTIAFAQEKTIKIGFVGDFSAVSQAYTHNMYKAAQMAVNEFNASGGLLGRTIRLIRRDGATILKGIMIMSQRSPGKTKLWRFSAEPRPRVC